MTEQLEIAILVRETRQQLGLTQEQLAMKLGVSYQSVNRWENRRTKPLPIFLKLIEEMRRSGDERVKTASEGFFPASVATVES